MSQGSSLEGGGEPRRRKAGSARPDFAEFRNRIQRLAESLIALRTPPPDERGRRSGEDRVEVNLESDAVRIEFFVTHLPWKTASVLADRFQQCFSGLAPLFLDCTAGTLKLRKSREKDGAWGLLHLAEDTALTLRTDPLNAGYLVGIKTNLDDFNDHFEAFVADAAKTLFPPTEDKPARKEAADLKSWYKEFGRDFERRGCRVLTGQPLGWKDLAGLGDLRRYRDDDLHRNHL